jgi:two-component system, LytTR family, response regulator LytT
MSVDAGNARDSLAVRVLVCEDEPVAREYLKLVLSRIKGVEVVGEAVDAAECLRQVAQLEPDVAFLDINLPDASGMDTAEALSRLSKPPKLVFVTGYDEHAVSAFDLAAVDYVLKPFDQERLERTVARIRAEHVPKSAPTQPTAHNGFPKLPIKDRESVKLIDPKDIYLVQTEGRKTAVCSKTGKYLTPYTVSELETRLPSPTFFRANEGSLVNLDFVKEVVHFGPRTYELLLGDPDNTFVPLSRSRAQKLKELLDL